MKHYKYNKILKSTLSFASCAFMMASSMFPSFSSASAQSLRSFKDSDSASSSNWRLTLGEKRGEVDLIGINASMGKHKTNFLFICKTD